MPLEAMRYDVTPIGLHYLLTHYDIPDVNPEAFRLSIGGLVDHPMSITLAELRSRPAVTAAVTMECAGNGRARLLPRPVSQPWLHEAVGTMRWTGTSLAPLLHAAGVCDQAVDVVFTGADHGVERGTEQDYARALPVAEALREDVLLVYEANGAPLPPQHGFPLRLVVPGWYGMASVKWLRSIEVIGSRFEGYQQRAYALRQETGQDGVPLTRIDPRALVIPPGFPDFMSRGRFLPVGSHVLRGRAWSGWAPVDRVEISVDDGASWALAELDPPTDEWAWRAWSFPWQAASPGRYVVSARATDATARTQPQDQPWNRGGFANTSPQRVEVVVTG